MPKPLPNAPGGPAKTFNDVIVAVYYGYSRSPMLPHACLMLQCRIVGGFNSQEAEQDVRRVHVGARSSVLTSEQGAVFLPQMAEEPPHVLLLSMVRMQLVSVILQHKPVKKVDGGIPDSVWAVEEICRRR
jgi:hypothetical protein